MSLPISPAQIVEQSDSLVLAAPDSWPRRPLGEVAGIVNGFAFKSDKFAGQGGVPLIRIRDIHNDGTEVGYVGDYDDRYLVETGDLLVGMDGDFECARWRGSRALLNQRVCKVVPDQEKLSLEFLTHILPGYLRAIQDSTSSTTVTHLSSRDIAQIPIPIPSLNEQQWLAGVLGAADAKRDSSRRRVEAARQSMDRFRRAVLTAGCSGRLTEDWRKDRPGPSGANSVTALWRDEGQRRGRIRQREEGEAPRYELPEAWVWARLGDFAASIEYGYTASATHEPIGPKLLRITDIQEESVDWESVPFCRIEPSRVEKYSLSKGDLLFARTGATTGKSYLVRTTPPTAVFASYLIRVRVRSPISPEYVYAFFRSPLYWQQIADASIGTGQPNVNRTKLANLWVPVPTPEEQAEIARRVGELLRAADAVCARIDAIQRHLNGGSRAVLVKALRGDFRFNESKNGNGSKHVRSTPVGSV